MDFLAGIENTLTSEVGYKVIKFSYGTERKITGVRTIFEKSQKTWNAMLQEIRKNTKGKEIAELWKKKIALS